MHFRKRIIEHSICPPMITSTLLIIYALPLFVCLPILICLPKVMNNAYNLVEDRSIRGPVDGRSWL
jgi:hypothetical protein